MTRMFRFSALFLLAVSAAVLSAPSAGHAAITRWAMATLAPKGMGWSIQVEQFVLPWVKDATEDNLRFKIYYGGIMGNDEDYIRKMKVGQLQAAGLTGHGANLASKEFSALGLPFLFKDYDEVDYVRDSMFSTFDFYCQQNGYKLMLWIDQGFDQIYSAKFRFDRLADFAEAKFQTWYGPQEAAMLKALGAQALEIPPTDASASYRKGVIDSNIGPAIFQVGSEMFTMNKFVNTMKIRYAPAVVLVNLKDWQALPDDYQDRLEAGRDRVQKEFVAATRQDNDRSLEGMLKYGLVKVDMTEDELVPIRKKAMTVYQDLSGELYPPELLVEVQRYLAAYHSGAPVAAAPAPAAPREKAVAQAPAPAPGPAPAPVAAQPAAKVLKLSDLAGKVPPAADSSSWARRKHEILQVQAILKEMGLYSSTLDGIYGPMTRQGVMQYQKAAGLRASGSIDDRLLKAMGIR